MWFPEHTPASASRNYAKTNTKVSSWSVRLKSRKRMVINAHNVSSLGLSERYMRCKTSCVRPRPKPDESCPTASHLPTMCSGRLSAGRVPTRPLWSLAYYAAEIGVQSLKKKSSGTSLVPSLWAGKFWCAGFW
jgi:hypothetical protein